MLIMTLILITSVLTGTDVPPFGRHSDGIEEEQWRIRSLPKKRPAKSSGVQQ